ncbi:PH domain-containing protein [Umezawaea sp. NPDC059074]|uniref:PH domain-containing protein n=1 Tax=Umezawaea sp. NPDC059074 TaxID=3346716 RepID=UPI0036958A8F
MTPLPSAEPTTRSWAPLPGVVALAWGLAAAALLAALLSDENSARLLMGVAALLGVVLGTYGTIVRPRLRVDDSGLHVRTLTGVHDFAWHEVKIRPVQTRRLGRESHSLELDWERGEDEHLVVLTWLDLGADPRDVAEVLHALRP